LKIVMSDKPWKIVYTRQGLKDKQKAQEQGFNEKIEKLLKLVKSNPFADYPPYEKLIGDFSGAYSRRINRQHRFVYQVYEAERTVKVISMWTHYE